MSNKIDLAGRNAVVTGGAQGIGRAIVERFLDSGAAVAIWDRDKAFAEKTAGEFEQPRQGVAVACDVTKLADVERARDDTVKALGRIDILVNNAGIAGHERRPPGTIRPTNGSRSCASISTACSIAAAPWCRA